MERGRTNKLGYDLAMQTAYDLTIYCGVQGGHDDQPEKGMAEAQCGGRLSSDRETGRRGGMTTSYCTTDDRINPASL